MLISVSKANSRSIPIVLRYSVVLFPRMCILVTFKKACCTSSSTDCFAGAPIGASAFSLTALFTNRKQTEKNVCFYRLVEHISEERSVWKSSVQLAWQFLKTLTSTHCFCCRNNASRAHRRIASMVHARRAGAHPTEFPCAARDDRCPLSSAASSHSWTCRHGT